MTGPIVTLPNPESPAPGLSGYVFPMQERKAPFGLIIFDVAPGGCTDAHSHDVHEYWLITAGVSELIYDNVSYTVKAGDLLYFEPHKVHQIVNNSATTLKVVSMDWHG